MNPQDLISALKSQHRTLQADLSSALERTTSGVKENGESIVSDLTKFKNDLLGHLKIENEVFYPDYLDKKIKRGEEVESTKKFINEMSEIAKVVMSFLDKYANQEGVAKFAADFDEDLMKIITALNMRIESEEEGVFGIYLLM